MAALVRRDRTVALSATTTVLGSAPDADVSIPSPHLSRKHALVVRDRKGWLIIDFRSANGVAVNGTPIEVQRLAEGDVITLSGAAGDAEVRLEFRESPESPPPVARRPRSATPAEAALRIAAVCARATDVPTLARAALDELMLLTRADRGGLIVDAARAYGRRQGPTGPIDETVNMMPGTAERLRAGETLIYRADCLPDNSAWAKPHAARAAIPILLVRSAITMALRVRGELYGMLQLERALFNEPFPRSAADVAEACRAMIALGLAARLSR